MRYSFISMDSEAKLLEIKSWLLHKLGQVTQPLVYEINESMHIKHLEQCLTHQRPLGHALTFAGTCKATTI